MSSLNSIMTAMHTCKISKVSNGNILFLCPISFFLIPNTDECYFRYEYPLDQAYKQTLLFHHDEERFRQDILLHLILYHNKISLNTYHLVISADKCVSGWREHSGQCYRLFDTETLDYSSAETYCSQRGARLVTIKT